MNKRILLWAPLLFLSSLLSCTKWNGNNSEKNGQATKSGQDHINEVPYSYWAPGLPAGSDFFLLFTGEGSFSFITSEEIEYLFLCMDAPADPKNPQKSYHLLFRMTGDHFAFKEGEPPTVRNYKNTPVDIKLVSVYHGEECGRYDSYGWEASSCNHEGNDIIKISTAGKQEYYLQFNKWSNSGIDPYLLF